MRYFIISQEDSYVDAPQIKGLEQEADLHKFYEDIDFFKKDRLILDVGKRKHFSCPDVLTKPCFMVSAAAWNVMLMFEPNLHSVEVLLNPCGEMLEIHQYKIPWLHKVNCLTEDSRFNLDRSEVLEPVIDEELIGDKAIFRLGGVGKCYIVMRMDLVEALLRRDIYGIQLQELKNIREV